MAGCRSILKKGRHTKRANLKNFSSQLSDHVMGRKLKVIYKGNYSTLVGIWILSKIFT